MRASTRAAMAACLSGRVQALLSPVSGAWRPAIGVRVSSAPTTSRCFTMAAEGSGADKKVGFIGGCIGFPVHVCAIRTRCLKSSAPHQLFISSFELLFIREEALFLKF